MHGIFKFKIKEEVIPVQPFDKLMNISKNIRNELIFSSEHSYEVESKVRQEIIKEFIKYIIFDEEPEITINNINEYELLSEEFSIYQERINNKKHEYGEYLINFQGLSSEDEGMRKISEERISTELDEYLNRYGEEMMRITIQSLYNIFNHSKRKLNNHNLAYEHIISYFNKTQDSNIFILLDLLDGSKLNRNNIEESYSLSSLRNNHIPKIDFSNISELFSIQRKQEQLLEEQRIKYSELLTTISQQQEQQEFKHKQIIETLENKIEQIINKQNLKQNELHIEQKTKYSKLLIKMNEQQLKQEQLIEEQRIKYSELLNKMNQQQEKQEQQETKLKQTFETLENKINQMISIQQQNQEKIIEEQRIKYSKTIQKLEERIKSIEQDKENFNNIINEQNSKITKLEKEVEIHKKTTSMRTQNNCQPFITKLDKSSPGILQRLKNNEKSPFDHLFIPSQSSNDIYNIIDPNTNDEFCITGIGKFIELELEETITITGIKLFSSTYNFPKSFDIEINDEIVAKCVSRLVFLKDKKILNLTGKTNTDLKLEYGAANLTYLSECDENYTTLSRTLNTYSARLYELGYESEARKVLEFAVETGSDSLSMYRLLADIYSGRNEADSLEYLLFKANQLDSMLKKTIVNDVSSRISK